MTNQYTKFAGTHLKFSPSAMYFHKESPMLLDLAKAISTDPVLRKYLALHITINVSEYGGKVIVTDVNTNEVLYCNHHEQIEEALAHDNYCFYVVNDVLMMV